MNKATKIARVKDILSVITRILFLILVVLTTTFYIIDIRKKLETTNNYNIEKAYFISDEMIVPQETTTE